MLLQQLQLDENSKVYFQPQNQLEPNTNSSDGANEINNNLPRSSGAAYLLDSDVSQTGNSSTSQATPVAEMKPKKKKAATATKKKEVAAICKYCGAVLEQQGGRGRAKEYCTLAHKKAYLYEQNGATGGLYKEFLNSNSNSGEDGDAETTSASGENDINKSAKNAINSNKAVGYDKKDQDRARHQDENNRAEAEVESEGMDTEETKMTITTTNTVQETVEPTNSDGSVDGSAERNYPDISNNGSDWNDINNASDGYDNNIVPSLPSAATNNNNVPNQSSSAQVPLVLAALPTPEEKLIKNVINRVSKLANQSKANLDKLSNLLDQLLTKQVERNTESMSELNSLTIRSGEQVHLLEAFTSELISYLEGIKAAPTELESSSSSINGIDRTEIKTDLINTLLEVKAVKDKFSRVVTLLRGNVTKPDAN